MTAVVVAFEICGGGFTAQIAVDALIVHVIGTCHVLGVFVCCVSHCLDEVGGLRGAIVVLNPLLSITFSSLGNGGNAA
jgi:hypothetical protein